LADVYDALIRQGRCVPAGSCVSVGMAGLTLGGGFGVIDRAYGLSCDALRWAQVVTADGQVLECDATRNTELFWALRGGGGGQFGVLTAMRFQTHAVSPLLQFRASFALDDLPAVMRAWQAWPSSLPDQVWSQLVLSPNGGAGGNPGCTVWGYGVEAMGQEAALLPHWQGLLTLIGKAPLNSSLLPQSYREAMLGDCGNLSIAQCHLPSQNSAGVLGRAAIAASSDFFNRTLDDAGIQALAQALQQRRGRSGTVILNLMGGAIARVPHEASAFPHRQALFSAQYAANFNPGTASSLIDEGAQWAHSLREVMRPWSSGGAYINYPDGLLSEPLPAYHGSHLTRLQQLKRAIDPGQLFKSAQGLTPA
jgi:FAD/FMN-containing dehydrogenase